MTRFTFLCALFSLFIGTVRLRADTYTEDFTQDDGPPAGWVIVRPTVTVEGGKLTLSPGGQGEVDTFAGQGGVGLWFDNITHIEFDISYPGDTGSWPFDHGGVIFCSQKAQGRYGTTCYTIDYLAQAPDHPESGRFRLGKFIAGNETQLTEKPTTEYEGTWEIDITETTITFSFNGEEQFTFEDSDLPRSGYIGFWAYQVPAENKVAVDNLSVEHTPGLCPGFLSDSVVLTSGKENAVLPIRIPLGANESSSYEVTVTSQDPGTASVVGSPLVFEVGDPLVKSVEIEPVNPGQTLISLSVEGQECQDAVVTAEVLAPVAYEEDFSQEDGPPEGWYVAGGTAQVINGELSLSAPGSPFVWYGVGGEALEVPKIDAVTFRIKFAQAGGSVGAHGGMILAPQPGTARDKGYMIDIIERDSGYRIYKDNQAGPGLVDSWPPYSWDDQWHTWEIVFTPTGFTFSVDGELKATVEDTTYRGGYLAFWCYTGAPSPNQNMFVDDVRIEFGSSACPSIEPRQVANRPVNPPTVFTVTAPFGVNAGGDYHPTVTSSDPTVAVPVDPDTGEPTDGSLVLDFPEGEGIVKTSFEVACLSPGTTEFTVDTGGTSCLVSSASFTVREPGESGFCDEFSQENGPPEEWTAWSGDWQVKDEKLTVTCATGEAPRNESWIWAFSPPRRIEGAATLGFSLVLSQEVPDSVGRHGGFMFFADDPTNRWETSGYEIDWIDRAADHGYRFIRSDNGVHTILAGPTGEEFELGTLWRVEVEGENLKFYVDDVLVFDVVDSAYREGYVGFWTYCNTTTAVFDDVIFGSCGTKFKRGDTNADDNVDIADAICVLGYLFGGPDDPCKVKIPACFDAADANDDGAVDIADGIKILGHLFAGDGPLPEPFGECGLDPTEEPPDILGCETYSPCE